MRPALVDWMARFMSRDLALILAPTWFTFVGLAGVITLLLMLRAARRAGVDRAVIAGAILWGYLAAVVAGIVVPMAIDLIEQTLRTGRPRLHWAGMTSFWGYLAGGVAVTLVARAHRIAPARLGDLAAAPLGVALACARLGCFVAGCDYGKVSSAPWAVRFPTGSPAWRDHVHAGLVPAGRGASLPVHPTQLYEAGLGLVIAALAIVVARTAWARARHGRVVVVAVVAYAIGRLGIEELRGDVGRGFFGPLSSGQVFALLLLTALAATWAWRRRRAATATAAALVAAALVVAAPGAVRAGPGADDGTGAGLPTPTTPAPTGWR
ncbi:MAG: prolipoprotein diacylglyceryl transferase [Kofleriaceae bacterium]|nr:prolipoprotein diacylglyceryl transferase [Kofleriaceae bacterium]